MNQPKPARAASKATMNPPTQRRLPRIASGQLLRSAPELIIEHAGREYHLRITRAGKLILTA